VFTIGSRPHRSEIRLTSHHPFPAGKSSGHHAGKKNMVKPWFSYRFVLFVNHSTFGTLEKNRNHHHWQVWSLAFGASMVLCRWWGRSPGGWDFHHGRQYPIGMDCIFNQGIYHISRFPKSWGYSQILLDHIRPWHRIETTVMTWGSHILRDPPYQYGISMDFTYSRVYTVDCIDFWWFLKDEIDQYR
jgi:hypothetical protein